MASNLAPEKVGKEQELSDNLLTSISLFKSGGAIRGISEKFAANPVTGTASMAVRNVDSCAGPGFGSKALSKFIYR